MPFPTILIGANSAPKFGTLLEGRSSDSSKDTSLYSKEVRGHAYYDTAGFIDIREQPFISLSDSHDRLYCSIDWWSEVSEILGKRLGSPVSPIPQFYKKEFDISGIPERGVLLTEEQNKFLVLNALSRFSRIRINSTTGWAKSIELKIRFIYDPIDDIMSSDCEEDNWIEIKNEKCKFNSNCLDNVSFSVGYIPYDDQLKTKEEYDSFIRKVQEANKKDIEKK
jgi:hypothetical protein